MFVWTFKDYDSREFLLVEWELGWGGGIKSTLFDIAWNATPTNPTSCSTFLSTTLGATKLQSFPFQHGFLQQYPLLARNHFNLKSLCKCLRLSHSNATWVLSNVREQFGFCQHIKKIHLCWYHVLHSAVWEHAKALKSGLADLSA